MLQAASGDSTAALERLCRAYWYPLYAFVRRQGHDAHDAQDLTQGFFELFLAKHYLKDVDRDKGRFRSFLLASLKHFLANEWKKANRQRFKYLKSVKGGITAWSEAIDFKVPRY